MNRASLTEGLRKRLGLAMGRCPTCNQGGMKQREAARQIGTSVSTVCRFLQGKGASSDFLDKLESWLKDQEGAE